MKTLIKWMINFSFILFIHAAAAHSSDHERIDVLNHDLLLANADSSLGHGQLYLNRGRVYCEAQKWQLALNDFTLAAKVQPDLSEALYWQGYVHFQLQHFAEAEKMLVQYLNAVPQSTLGYQLMAQLAIKNQQYFIAAGYFDKAIEVNPLAKPQLYFERVQVLKRISPYPLQRIVHGLEEGLERLGPQVNLLDYMVEVYVAVEQFHPALQWHKQYPEVVRRTPAWMLKQAQLQRAAGAKVESENWYRRALATLDTIPLEKQSLPALRKINAQARRELAQVMAMPK